MNPESTASRLTPQAILLIALIGGSFAADSFLRFPIPGTNEPHYLCKAKHYWNPEWGAGDFFLESSNAHTVFYQVVGCFTQWLTLFQTAVLARLTAFLLLAIGWYRLFRVLTPGIWSPLIAAWIYLGIVAIGNFSGEWIIGGVESKVFAYGFLFLAVANACEQRWNRSGIYAGLTISWHPVVGVWMLLCGLFSLLCLGWLERKNPSRITIKQTIARGLLPMGLLTLFALPGLIPAISLLLHSDSRNSFAANYIQVFYRIKHHLDPMDFHAFGYLFYAGLLALWFFLWRKSASTFPNRFFQGFLLGTLGLACVGFLLGVGPRPASEMPYYAFRMSLLKFYPFRLFDALLPIAVTVVLVNAAYRYLFVRRDSSEPLPPTTLSSRKTMVTLIGLSIFTAVLVSAWRFPPVHKMSPGQRQDWVDACLWINEHVPQSSLFLTPAHTSDFKWFAQRPEYVTVKDCPQDASGIVEWNRRLKYLRKWGQEYYNEGFDDPALQTLKENTNITHLLVKRLGPFKTLEPIYQNQTYKIYELP